MEPTCHLLAKPPVDCAFAPEHRHTESLATMTSRRPGTLINRRAGTGRSHL